MAGLYHTISDAPEQLKIEAETMTVKVSYGVPSTGQATVSWEIPTPARGCSSGDAGSYCGIVVVLADEPIKPSHFPTDGKYYHDDPTADSDKHTGDKIGDGLVVGSFWEREAKSTNSSDMMTSFVINDIDPSIPYYIAGFMMDCSLRYHTEGIRAYSDEVCHHHLDDSGVAAFQNVALGADGQGVLPTDGTGLLPGKIYEFDIVYDPDFPTGKNFQNFSVRIDGMEAGTYEDLLTQINEELRMMGNPAKLPYPPNYGHLYWNEEEQKLYKYDGTQYVEETSIYVQSTDPSIFTDGTFWYNPETGELKSYCDGSPCPSPGWHDAPFMTGGSNPNNMECDQYWFDGTTAFMWNGTNWVELTTIVQGECPSAVNAPSCGTYWYDTDNEILYQWDAMRETWVETAAIYWPYPPNEPKEDDYWMNESSLRLSKWMDQGSTTSPPGSPVGSPADPGSWYDISDMDHVFISELEPTAPGVGALWYQISTEALKRWDIQSGTWDEVPVMVWPDDPRNTEANDLWWNSDDEYLYSWDALESDWVPVADFIESAENPLDGSSAFEVDTVWFDSDTNTAYRWDGETWVEVEALVWPLDPTDPGDGAIYYDETNDVWYMWSSSAPVGWVEFEPLVSDVDPSQIPNGYYWMNTTNDNLSIRNGIEWIPVAYDTVPKHHNLYDEWFNTQDGNLYMWNGSKWVISNGVITAGFADFVHEGCKIGGGFQFKTILKGTGNILFIPCSPDSESAGPGCMKCVTSGYADFTSTPIAPGGPSSSCAFHSEYGGACGYPVRVVHEEDFLWSHLTYPASLMEPQEGQDSPHNKSSYDVIGVGTDGTPDERRELADSIRRQLGYPSITVELTHYQIDTSIQGALESYRKRTSASLKRGYYFLDLKPKQQRYMMTNRRIGYDRIVQVMDTHRFSSAFLTQAHAAGHYGQVILQHLYNMGSYDLLSYDLVSQYINQMEISFAARLAFGWNEDKRTLDFYQSFTRPERILLDVMVERTEQEILKDRFAKSWIERYALSEAMMVLSHIRGKFGTLPGAGGGIQLNSDQLQAISDSYRQELIAQIDEFIIEKPEEVGMASTFVFG